MRYIKIMFRFIRIIAAPFLYVKIVNEAGVFTAIGIAFLYLSFEVYEEFGDK